ncbi:unnamed protein product [Phyllotreta striolata]|uniref:G-protein coupled receptors family 1 profile domain-containing protein n=1 Tax=Phyllotreta striolata TaxID=444603 RepID=A0A9P0DKR4_PHYSR|nr:unnamed protein product [Phyllotreta striolata]
MNATTKYCDLEGFQNSYAEIHGLLSVFVCVLGSVANVLNICVLTRKEMTSPTNLILTGLALADLLVMVEYIPFSYYNYLNIEKRKYISHFSYSWAVFMIFHALFSQLFHFISCCLTVILALWRLLTIKNPPYTKFWCNLRTTLIVIISTYLLCPLICFPLYKTYTIQDFNQTIDANDKIIKLTESKNTEIFYGKIYVIQYVNHFYSQLSFWLYTVVIKLVPCILLTFLSTKLIMVLVETKNRKNRLLGRNIQMTNLNKDSNAIIVQKTKDKQADRTSVMLVAVLLLFLITEFPQAILGLLSATMGETFYNECYMPLGDVMDIFALTNSGINFILYCTMSRQFRSTFGEFFKLKRIRKFNSLIKSNAREKIIEKDTQLTAVN